MKEAVEKQLGLEELLERKMSKFWNICQTTNKETIFVFLDALEFCEKNYKHCHEGTDRYIRANLTCHNTNEYKNLLECYAAKRADIKASPLRRNYGMVGLLMSSLLEYARQTTPKGDKAATEAKVKAILEPVLFDAED